MISLTNTCLKFLTNLAANIFQKVITRNINDNRYAFIKDRTIHDSLGWPFEFIHECQQSKRKIVILKIGIVKAFNTLDHTTIIQVMKGKGFHEKFLEWVQEVISFGSSSILLNRVHRKSFVYRRGVRQGAFAPSSLCKELIYCRVWSIELYQEEDYQLQFP